MTLRCSKLTSFAVLILLVGLPSTASFAAAPERSMISLSPARFSDVSAYASYNWAGYAINATSGSVTQVKGSWVQPSITCPSAASAVPPAVAFWVGIDGLLSTTVEQTGTLAVCTGTVASYFAWYEFYPAQMYNFTTIKVSPGDTMSATVKYSTTTGEFTATLKDVTTGKSASATAAVSGAERSSAEWITEAPEYCVTSSGPCSLASLPNFGTTSFGKDSTSVSGTDSATISGKNQIISKFGTMVDSLTMVEESNINIIKVAPSGLSTDGTSFSVTFDNAGP